MIAGAVTLWSGAVVADPVRVKVVATFSILGDLIHQIGGKHVNVVTLIGPDGDAHVFEPTPSHARSVKTAQLIVSNGLGLEGWMPRLFQSSGYHGPVVVATDGIPPRTGHSEEHDDSDKGHGDHGNDDGIDPHAWQNVANVKIYIRNIAEALIKVDPDHATIYQTNATAYTEQLSELDRQVRTAFAKLPAAKRKIITSHDAFGYFGDAYGLTLLAPAGVNTASEPSAKGMAALIDQIRKEQIKAVFVENISHPRLIQRIAKESGAKVGGQLFSDALSPKSGPAATYLDMIRHNTKLITDAIGE